MTEKKIPVFVHVPKTAGTTFRMAVEKYLGGERILWDYGPDSPVTSPVVKEFLYQKGDLATLRLRADGYEFISGHFNSMKWKEIIPSGRLIAFLRDPVQRVVSLFNHMRTHDDPELRKVSLYDWVAGRYSMQADNHQVRIIGSVEVPFGRVGEAEFNRAKDILDNVFDTVGITERFDESFYLIRTRLGWDDMYYVSKNKLRESVEKRYELDSRTIDLLRESNQWDMRLYEYARQKFDAMIRGLGDRFQAEVAEFKKANARYLTAHPEEEEPALGMVARSPVPAQAKAARIAKAARAARVAKAVGARPKKLAPGKPAGNYLGRLQGLKENRVSGWAMSVKEPARPVTVELLINGQLLMTAKAKAMKKPLLERQAHPTGLCGFVFKLGDADTLKAGDEVVVRVKGTEQPIDNCPRIFGA